MGERPIIFSAPMVRAILASKKTQTRRLLTPQPYDFRHPNDGHRCWNAAGRIGGRICINDRSLLDLHRKPHPGDLLWVRENWRLSTWNEDGDLRLLYPADGARSSWLTPEDGDYTQSLLERACDELEKKNTPKDEDGNFTSADSLRTRPSIHMPRWASRITLKVTGVKVERLQEISEEDAIAEGIKEQGGQFGGIFTVEGATSGTTAAACFQRLWESIHGPGSWEENPWVVAISFERVANPPSRDGGRG